MIDSNTDDDDLEDGYKPYQDDDEDGLDDDEDDDADEFGKGNDRSYNRDRRHAERIARALDGVEDDDDEDGDDLDFDDDNAFNPREDESLL